MRKLLAILSVFVALSAVPASAQQATLATPVVRPAEHNLRVESYFATRDSGGRWEIQVSVRDSTGVEIRRQSFSGPDAAHPTATALAFVTAQDDARVGETGGKARVMDYRLLGFLADNGYLPPATVVP